MKKFILLTLIILGIFSFSFVFAEESKTIFGLKTSGKISGLDSSVISKTNDLTATAGNLIGYILSFVGVYFFVLFVYSGIVYMTAAGAKEKIDSSKKKMISAVIGLTIILSAYALISLIFSFILAGGGNFQNETNCTNKTDGTACKTADCTSNCVCQNEKCITECEFEFKQIGGKCMDVNSCDTINNEIEIGYCPGGKDNICCVPSEIIMEHHEDPLPDEFSPMNFEEWWNLNSSSPRDETPKNKCEEAGDECTTEALCTAMYNGKVMSGGGCGVGEVCCRACQFIGGHCIDTNTEKCSPPSKNLKSGYCHGDFVANNFKCCIGISSPK